MSLLLNITVTTDPYSPTSMAAAEAEGKQEEKTDDTMAAGEHKPPDFHEKGVHISL